MDKHRVAFLVLVFVLCGCVNDSDLTVTTTTSSLPDPSICTGIENEYERDTCYFNISAITKDSAICEMIQRQEIKGFCYAVTKKDLSVCEQRGEQINKDLCYEIVGRMIEDSMICGNIQDPDIRHRCLAKTKKDLTECDNIQNPLYKDDCYLFISTERKDPEICEKIDVYRDNCYMNIALDTNNPSLCESIEQQLTEDLCYVEIAKATKNPELCNRAGDTVQYIEKCISDCVAAGATTTTTLPKAPETFEDAFEIARTSPLVISELESRDCVVHGWKQITGGTPFGWNKVSGILHVINDTIVECQNGGYYGKLCPGSSGILLADFVDLDTNFLFGREISDYYVIFIFCDSYPDYSILVVIDAKTGEQRIKIWDFTQDHMT